MKPTWLVTILWIAAQCGCAEGQGPRMAVKVFSNTPTGPLIIAHRGGSLEAPENTIASVSHGIVSGSDFQEIDVTLTADNVLVVIHDDTLERTTLGAGHVEEKRWDEIAGLSAGAPQWTEKNKARLAALDMVPPTFDARYAGERLPTLEQILRIPGVRLMIELKTTPRARALAQAAVHAVQQAGMQNRVAVGSFSYDIVEAVHQADPTLPLIGIIDDVEAIAPMLRLPVDIIAADKDLLAETRARVPEGVAVWVWTAYHPREARQLADGGADGIITDAPATVRRSLRGAP